MILKYVHNISGESMVEQWSENLYYQYFCGEQQFVPGHPERRRTGSLPPLHRTKGIELIFRESIRINDDDTAFIDTTVQEKKVTFLTDAKRSSGIYTKNLRISILKN